MRIKIKSVNEYKIEDINIEGIVYRDIKTNRKITKETKEVYIYDGGEFKGSKLIIPEYYKGIRVIAIDGWTFTNCKNLEEIEIPNTVVKNCSNLKEINLSSSIKEINIAAFHGCERLRADIQIELINKWGCEI